MKTTKKKGGGERARDCVWRRWRLYMQEDYKSSTSLLLIFNLVSKWLHYTYAFPAHLHCVVGESWRWVESIVTNLWLYVFGWWDFDHSSMFGFRTSSIIAWIREFFFSPSLPPSFSLSLSLFVSKSQRNGDLVPWIDGKKFRDISLYRKWERLVEILLQTLLHNQQWSMDILCSLGVGGRDKVISLHFMKLWSEP